MYIGRRMSVENQVLLGVIEYTEAKRIRGLLEDQGIELKFVNNPETCGTGDCKPSVEVYAAEIDMPRVREFLTHERERAFEGLDVDPALANEIYDPEKESARCPACGTEFSTKLTECPDCGLVFQAV
jgi:hypothetical protein